jgi:histidinol phosphatase-like enzyme (inositol monophosphatase family)
LLALAVRLAREAGAATLRRFRSRDLGLRVKENGTPVTDADLEAERLLRDRIRAACPDDGIVGEEYGEDGGRSGRTWILDPIDGTKAFVRGVPLYGTLVGVEERGVAVAGVAFLPALGELVFGARGRPTTWVTGVGGGETARPARVSSVGRAGDALLCTTSVGGFERSGRIDLYRRLRAAFGTDRGWGDCYGHVLVATGRAEVMVDPVMAVWDCAALQPIVEGAGGTFHDLSGRATHRGGSAVSTNGLLRGEIAALIAG